MELATDLSHRFQNVGSGVAVERQRERLDGIPSQRKLTIPKEVLADRYRQLDINTRLVACLLLIIVARDGRLERYVRRQPMQLPVPEELHVLVLLIDEMGEGLERLGVGCPAVIHRPTIVVSVLIDIVRVIEVLLAEGVAEREVGRIPWHGILHCLHVELEVRDGEILCYAISHSIFHDTVFLVFGLTGGNSFLESDILIKRIILGCRLFVAIRIIDRSTQFHLLGDETTQITLHSNIVLVEIIQSTVREALVHRSEAFGLLMESHIDGSYITHVERHGGTSCPTALGIKVGHTQLIDPNDTTLGRG